MPTTPLRQRPAWKALEQHYAEIGPQHLRDLFAADPGRGERLTAEAAGLYLDYSKNRVTDETMALLVQLAQECGVEQRRDAMFRGDRINVSEHRSVRGCSRCHRRRRRSACSARSTAGLCAGSNAEMLSYDR